MKTLVIQKDINRTDITGFLNLARDREADLVCFGELALTGCLYERGEPAPLEDTLRLLEPYDMRIMVGLAYADTDHLYNAYLYYHGGEYRIYHKINLFPPFNEPQIYDAGHEPGIWEIDKQRVGVAICYDLRFPEVFDQLKQQGAEKVFVPAAFPRVRIGDWRQLLIERAKHTGLWMVGINSVGFDGQNLFGGDSLVVDGDGQVVIEAEQTSEQVLQIDLP